MAKMYYSLEETTAKLNCTEEQLKGLVRAGKVREFRDAGKLAYRVDEVDRLASETGDNVVVESDDEELALEDSGEIALAPESEGESDSGITAALSGSGSTAGLSGFDLEEPDTAASELGESDAAGMLNLEDTGGSGEEYSLTDSSLESDTGEIALEDSSSEQGAGEVALEDSGSADAGLEDSGSGTGADILSLDEVDKDVAEGMKKDDTVITNIGISVFDDDDLEITADPMAKTLMTGADEHLGLDGSGAGSGLLDLTRESDDTSLGAELLEGIDMGDTSEALSQPVEEAEEAESEEEVQLAESAAEATVAAASLPMQVAGAPVLVSPAFTGLLIAATIALVLLGALGIATGMKVWPNYLAVLANNFWFFIGGTLVLGGLFSLVGWFMGRPPSGPRTPKKTKEKKGKGRKKAGKGKEAEAA
ncbi:MAG: hypothetical protein JSV03_09275 [Planctomycetota bacterium]|nr:MAG: hypothetical protein JSV03_09275 [Planctomycetota bacterium]